MDSRESISRLSRMIDTAVSFKSSAAHNDAYKRAMSDLEKAVQSEERFRKENAINLKLQDQAEQQERDLKRALNQHHSMVLKQQVEERAAARLAETQDRHMPDINPMFHGYPNMPQTPFDRARENQKQINNQVKTDLELQMLNNERIREHHKNEERVLDNFRAQMAKVSMEQDLKALQEKQKLERDILRNAWKEALDMKQLRQNIVKLEKGQALDSRVSTPYSMRSQNPETASQIADPVPEVDEGEKSDPEEAPDVDTASQRPPSPPESVAASAISEARSKAASIVSAQRQKQLQRLIAYSTSSKQQQAQKGKVSAARDEISKASSRTASATVSQRSQSALRFKNIGAASIFSSRSSRNRSQIMTPSDKLYKKLAELDAKEQEINNRKAKIRNMLNQELNMSNVKSTGRSLNKTVAEKNSKSFYTQKVKPPSEIDKESRRASGSIRDTVGDLIKGVFD